MLMLSMLRRTAMATTGKKMPRGALTYHGFLPATDPRYRSGWNFLSGKFLNPQSTKPSNEPAKPPQKPEEPPKAGS
jgi:hypothetical protein